MRRPTPSMAVAITALVAGLGGVAVASPIGGDGKVHLCFDQEGMDTHQSGAVRAVKAGSACPDGFTSFVLNQTGPQGPQGAPGAPGSAGPQGAPGGVKHLEEAKRKATIDDLKQADKLADKTKDKLDEIAAKLKQAEDRKKQQQQVEALIRQQIQAAAALAQINRAIEEMTRAQRRIVEELG